MKSEERHEQWVKKNAPEFTADNFEDVSDSGNKRQCSRCQKWFSKGDLSSEFGISLYCKNCIMKDPERCLGY